MPFILPAYAQTGAQQGSTELFNTLLMFGLIFLVFYFLVIRPQQKKMKQHREMLGALRRGDRVVTAGGIIGLVTRVVNEQEVMLEIADTVRVRVVRDTITSVMAKTEPVGGKAEGTGSSDEESGAAKEETGVLPGLRKLLGGKNK
ncbi:MAG: preprotein translocase subunit YajC [Rhodospirillaceae bacterium]|nr:MAG: preprotein translocase subunit YajC [Rhodospirillaceae bacterium]